MELKEIKTKLEEKVPAFAAKVQPIYELLHWEWSRGKSEPHVPSVAEIENNLHGLIEALEPSDHDEVGAGGLSAYYRMPDKDQSGCYGLAFELEEEDFFD